MEMSRPMSVGRKIRLMPIASFDASFMLFNPVWPRSPNTEIMPMIVPTRPSKGAMPTMISSTKRPRSSLMISWRAAFGERPDDERRYDVIPAQCPGAPQNDAERSHGSQSKQDINE